MILGLALAWIAICAGCWFGWQLLRQNGRLLLRLEALEGRLDELEFGEGHEPQGLSLGSEAPAFELPDLAGERHTLAQHRGQSTLVIFFNPACGFCRELVPKLADLCGVRRQAQRDAALEAQSVTIARNQSAVAAGALQNGGVSLPLVLIISTGKAEANRQLFNKHKLDCPVLLQQEMEVAAVYKTNGTPSGYLISPEGKIASGLAIGADALLEIGREPRSEKSEIPIPESQNDESLLIPQGGTATGNGDNRSGRFSNHSVARSKLKRDGLKVGTPAPDFRLPRLDGRGDLSLSDFRGQRVLLVFSSPNCGPCKTLAPQLEKFHRVNCRSEPSDSLSSNGGGGKGEEASSIQVIMISKGEPKENRAKVKEHCLTFPIVLQQQWEISRRYAMFATPIAYLIDEAGIIAQDVAVGIEAIQTLCDQVAKPSKLVVPVPAIV